MLEWAKSTAWKGAHPVVELSRTVYEKGDTVAKLAKPTSQTPAALWRSVKSPRWAGFYGVLDLNAACATLRGLPSLDRAERGSRVPGPSPSQ